MWVLLGLLCALFLATSDMLCKKALEREDAFIVAWARLAFASPFLLALAGSGTPPRDIPGFVWTVAALTPLEVLALYLYMAALKKSPLSLTAPFLAFTPGFMTITGWVILGERVSGQGLAGIGLVVMGAYVLSAGGSASGPLAPLRNFLREPGSIMMAGVAFIYSITAAGGKRLILLSSPMFVACYYFLAILAALTLVLALTPGGLGRIRRVAEKRVIWAAGLAQAGMVITHSLAMSLAPAAYMIAIKRTSLFFGVLYGIAVFGEKNAGHRVPGSAIMLAGVLVLGFFCC